MRGADWGEYANKDFVVIGDEHSAHYGEIGVVEKRSHAGYETDLVRIGCLAVCVDPKNIRRIRPGDMIVKVRP